MMKLFKKSKKGITLVESVFAVVILSILTVGIITLLTTGGVKIFEISQEADAYSEAVQKADRLLAAISNGYGEISPTNNKVFTLPANQNFDISNVVEIRPSTETFGSVDDEPRGWYITMQFGAASEGASEGDAGNSGFKITFFVSNTRGAFDRE